MLLTQLASQYNPLVEITRGAALPEDGEPQNHVTTLRSKESGIDYDQRR